MTCEYSVETEVSAAFAWEFWTNVANWSDPPASFELEGPFAAGSRGRTLMPGQEPRLWWIESLDPGKSGVIQTALDGATVSFEWRFEGLGVSRSRITQRISIVGEKAEAYREGLAVFEANLPDGMRRIAGLMASAAG